MNHMTGNEEEFYEGKNFEKEEAISKVDDMVLEASLRLRSLEMSKPRQSELKFKRDVYYRCIDIQAAVYKYWEKYD